MRSSWLSRTNSPLSVFTVSTAWPLPFFSRTTVIKRAAQHLHPFTLSYRVLWKLELRHAAVAPGSRAGLAGDRTDAEPQQDPARLSGRGAAFPDVGGALGRRLWIELPHTGARRNDLDCRYRDRRRCGRRGSH